MQLFVLGIVWAFPPTATWLPKALFQASRPPITAPATGKQPESGATSPSRKSGPSAKPKFDENGIPVEDDDPMGFSKRQDAKPKFDKDGIRIEDDDPMGFTKKR